MSKFQTEVSIMSHNSRKTGSKTIARQRLMNSLNRRHKGSNGFSAGRLRRMQEIEKERLKAERVQAALNNQYCPWCKSIGKNEIRYKELADGCYQEIHVCQACMCKVKEGRVVPTKPEPIVDDRIDADTLQKINSTLGKGECPKCHKMTLTTIHSAYEDGKAVGEYCSSCDHKAGDV